MGKDDVTFAEKAGEIALFSVAEVRNLFENAAEIYGEDRYRHAQMLLKGIAENPDRRAASKAPTKVFFESLRQSFPNFNEVIDALDEARALSELTTNSWFHTPPLLLVGAAGIGKTAFAHALAKGLDVDFNRFDIATTTMASALGGLSFGWGGGHIGQIFNGMIKSKTVNPLFMPDEVDKGRGHDFSPITPLLLALLEKESAASFKDEAILLSLNCSHINWIATANDINLMSEPLLSRFNIVNVHAPSSQQMPLVIKSIYFKLLKANPWGKSFSENLEINVIDKLSSMNPREIQIELKLAFEKVAIMRRNTIEPSDICLKKLPIKNRIGFLL